MCKVGYAVHLLASEFRFYSASALAMLSAVLAIVNLSV